MRRQALTWLLPLVLIAGVHQATAQHIYFDTDGDGVQTSADVLRPVGATEVAVYLNTIADADGTPRTCNAHTHASEGQSQAGIDLFSYDLVLAVKPSSGTVQWGEYVDEIGFSKSSSDRTGANELLITRRGISAVSPGRYRLGTIRVTTVAGTPVLTFGTTSKLDPAAFTGFGTHCAGSTYPNTYLMGVDWPEGGNRLELPTAAMGKTALLVKPPSKASNPETTISFSLGARADVRLAVYDVAGRLVSMVLRERDVPVGTRTLFWSGKTTNGALVASGIYFVRLEARSERISQRLVLVK